MRTMIKLQIEKLEENGEEYYLATSDDIQGLVAEGKTIEEVIEIASDLARIMLELDAELNNQPNLATLPNQFEYPLILEV